MKKEKEHKNLETACEKARDKALEKANSALEAMNILHEMMGSGAWSNTFDEEGNSVAVEWSDAFRAILGYESREDFPDIEDAFYDRVQPQDLQRLSDVYDRAVQDTSGKIIYDMEFRARTKSGEYRWFKTKGRMMHRGIGKAGTFYGMIMDIDDQKKTEAELLWRDTLADIMTQSLDSVYVVMNRRDRKSVYVSPSIEHVFGIKKDIEKPLLAIQKMERLESDDFTIKEIIALPEGKSLVKECWILPVGDNSAKLFQKTVYHVAREHEDLLIFEFADHTYEQEIRKNIEDALEIARSANAAKSSFLSNMSHDIRTPMNVIMGLAKLMEHEVDNPEKLRDYIQKIQTSSNHLLGLINDVLDMSKIESGETKLHVEKFDLLEQINEIETLIRPQAMGRDQTFEVNIEKIKHKNLEGDALRVRQIFINILANAVKYTQFGGKITFRIAELKFNSESYAKYRFVITDNGCGMKKEYLSRIFEPFSRQENSVTNKIQGTGLGMAITKNIVDMMGGTIQVESTEGKGTSFELILEFRIDLDAKDSGMTVHSSVNKAAENDTLQGKRFLCAEDNELNAEILQALLETEGAACEICSNGAEIVRRFEEIKPGEFDIILMDVQMPVLNGLEAARKIRTGSNPLGKTIPIIAMTANAFADDIQQSIEAGMNAHISKPMDLEVLKRTVKKILSQMI